MMGSVRRAPFSLFLLRLGGYTMATTHLNDDQLLSIDQTAAILGINRNTLSIMIKDNTAPPFITISRRKFILSSELRRWVESKQRRAKSAQRKRQHEYRVA